MARLSCQACGHLVESSPKPMNVGVARIDGSLSPGLGHPPPGWLVVAVERHLRDKLLDAVEKLRLRAFLEKRLVFSRAGREQQAAACRNLKGSRRVLIGTNCAKEAESNRGATQGARIVIAVYLAALMCRGQPRVTMKHERV